MIQDLIQKYCPEGIPHVTIGDIAEDIYRGSGIKREEVVEAGIPCVRYGEIYTTYGLWFDNCVSHTLDQYVKTKRYFEHGDILFAITGESVEDIAKSCAYMGNERCLAGGDIVVLKHSQNPKYLAYVLETDSVKRQKSFGKVKSKVVHSSIPDIKRIVIPLPPRPIQDAVAKILDELASNTDQLVSELEQELVIRRKQYDFLRMELLKQSDTGVTMPLHEIASYWDGKPHERIMQKEGKFVVTKVKFISSDGEYRMYCDQRLSPVEGDDIIMVMSDLPNGKSLAKCFYIDEDNTYTINQRVCAFRVKENIPISARYLFHILNRNPQLLAYDNGWGQTHLKKNDIVQISIPVPSLDLQGRIVSILEEYSTTETALESQIEAEIISREKQLRFYINHIMSFTQAS